MQTEYMLPSLVRDCVDVPLSDLTDQGDIEEVGGIPFNSAI
jgi:hypothetical protein